MSGCVLSSGAVEIVRVEAAVVVVLTDADPVGLTSVLDGGYGDW